MLVDFVEKEDGSVILTPSTDEGHKTISTPTKEIAKYRNIPFGRAMDCPTLTQQAIDDDKHDRRRRPFVSLAVVGMVVENDDSNDGTDNLSLLCTRRPSYMRSFPGAFVFPGGNVDADDESLEHALTREIFEETGLHVAEDSWKLECLWESIFPTQLPTLVTPENMSANNNIDSGIKAHHLVCYFSGRPDKKRKKDISLKLCEEEVDGAVWMSRDNIQDILTATKRITVPNHETIAPDIEMRGQQIALHASNSNTTIPNSSIPLSDLTGIYPRLNKNDGRFCGIAQGSLFALEEFIRNISVKR